jgi:hypothetical protein
MEGRQQMRISSAPTYTTVPVTQKAEGPPVVRYESVDNSNDSDKSEFQLFFPSPSVQFSINPDDTSVENLGQRLLRNLRQLYFDSCRYAHYDEFLSVSYVVFFDD